MQIGPIWTPPEYHSRGYSRAIVALTLQKAKEQGVEKAILFTDNPVAAKACEAIGFEEIWFISSGTAEKTNRFKQKATTMKPIRPIRYLEENEWPLLKELRLKALLSNPDTFSENFDETKGFPDEYWMDLMKNTESKESSKVFILENEDQILGFIFGIRRKEECRLGGLWVDPKHRKQGLGNLLVDHVKNWTSQFNDTAYLKLWALQGKLVKFYRECGFQVTKNIKKHPINNNEMVEMVWRNGR